MNITEGSELFWLIIERDVVDVPFHIMNAFTFVGNSNAISFKTLNENDIKETEKYVSEELSKHSQINEISDQMKKWLFGRFSMNPSTFHFDIGDVKLIIGLADYIKQKVDTPTVNCNLDYFRKGKKSNLRSKSNHQLHKCALGDIFGEKIRDIVDESETEQIDIKQALYEKSVADLNGYQNESFKPKREFNLDSVTIYDSNDETARGSIICSFCEDLDEAVVKLFCKRVESGCWVMSNLTTHMHRHHPGKSKSETSTPTKVRLPKKDKTPTKSGSAKSTPTKDKTPTKFGSTKSTPTKDKSESLAKRLKFDETSEQISETNTPKNVCTLKKEKTPTKSSSAKVKTPTKLKANETPAKCLKIQKTNEQTSETNTAANKKALKKMNEPKYTLDKDIFANALDLTRVKAKNRQSSSASTATSKNHTKEENVEAKLSLKKQIASQIHAQILKINDIDGDGDDDEDFRKLKATKNYIQLTKLPGEKNCLFAALEYQLYPDFQSVEEQEKNIRLFRAEVVDHIKNNLDVFKEDLQKRMSESERKFTKRSIEKEYYRFLDHLGSEDGQDGIETIHSVSMMKEVNIISIGPCGSGVAPCGFNPSYKSCLLIRQKEVRIESLNFLSDDIVERVSKEISEVGDIKS